MARHSVLEDAGDRDPGPTTTLSGPIAGPVGTSNGGEPAPALRPTSPRVGRHAAAGPVSASTRRRRQRWAGFAWWVAVFVVAVLIAALVRAFVLQSFWIPSGSMEPTLHGCSGCQNDRVLVDKLSYHLHSVNRGDVVVFHRPVGVPDEDTYLIKRVIGLPGETVSARNGTVIVGGRTLVESYVSAQCGGTADFGPTTVPAGEVFVMGDNRCGSLDSRRFGAIRESTIVGRAFMIVWPLARRHWL